jgi:endonuclease/exonuclease/phosphatase family metal-dependent hydrolase
MDAPLKFGSFNTWCGCKLIDNSNPESTIDFIVERTQSYDVLFLQEVHLNFRNLTNRHAKCQDSKWRPGPLDLELGARLKKRLEKSYNAFFTSHFFNALHDCEATKEPVAYGNLLLVKKSIEILKYSEHIIFGNGNLFEQRAMNCRPAARSSQVLTINFRNKPFTMEGVHGLWTPLGKVDTPERNAQSAKIISSIEMHRHRKFTDNNPLIAVIGDLNYQSGMRALQKIVHGLEQMSDGSENLNYRFGINDTRTNLYPSDKQTREADFLITTKTLAERIESYTVNRDVPSDHAWLTATTN